MQTTGDGINDELRIYTGETSLFLAGPRFGGMDSTLASGAPDCCFIRERSALAVGSFERGMMIQLCGIVRV